MRVVYGMNPVRELLRAGGEGIAELWLAEGGDCPRAFAELEEGARGHGAKVRTAPRSKLDRLAGVTQHQGIVAVVADYRYREVEDILAAARLAGKPPLVVLLDGVEDPHNLGAVVRSAHALGAHGVIFPPGPRRLRDPFGREGLGRCGRAPAHRPGHEPRPDPGGAEGGGALDGRGGPGRGRGPRLGRPQGADRARHRGEGQGVRPLVRKSCDHAARIPMAGRVGSLNASAAAAIAIYEAMRQRGESTGKIPA